MKRLDGLRGVVSSELIERAEQISADLSRMGVPHVLIGGLAVGAHGHVRATRDVDFLVGEEAFESTTPLLVFREELRDLVQIGHTDLMSLPPNHPQLQAELALSSDVPVISLPALVVLKLEADRPRDREDVRTLIIQHRARLREIRDYLREHAPALESRLAEALVERRSGRR